jgi:hypothetical protein
LTFKPFHQSPLTLKCAHPAKRCSGGWLSVCFAPLLNPKGRRPHRLPRP